MPAPPDTPISKMFPQARATRELLIDLGYETLGDLVNNLDLAAIRRIPRAGSRTAGAALVVLAENGYQPRSHQRWSELKIGDKTVLVAEVLGKMGALGRHILTKMIDNDTIFGHFDGGAYTAETIKPIIGPVYHGQLLAIAGSLAAEPKPPPTRTRAPEAPNSSPRFSPYADMPVPGGARVSDHIRYWLAREQAGDPDAGEIAQTYATTLVRQKALTGAGVLETTDGLIYCKALGVEDLSDLTSHQYEILEATVGAVSDLLRSKRVPLEQFRGTCRLKGDATDITRSISRREVLGTAYSIVRAAKDALAGRTPMNTISLALSIDPPSGSRTIVSLD